MNKINQFKYNIKTLTLLFALVLGSMSCASTAGMEIQKPINFSSYIIIAESKSDLMAKVKEYQDKKTNKRPYYIANIHVDTVDKDLGIYKVSLDYFNLVRS